VPPAPAVDDAVVEHLKSLGYLQSASPRGDRTLANLAFEAGRYAEAAATYEALVRDSPSDAGLHASLAGALGALGRLDEAREQLRIASQLDPLSAEAHHNQAAILERQGKPGEAIAEYRAALRYHPDYEPSHAALRRLGAPENTGAPRDPDQDRARQLAARAQQSARRGAYDEALAALDEAERLAPRDALLAQYRSNVAYLKGDRAAAIAALEHGLELEPDNQPFRQNLRRLQQDTTTAR
jgi:tetratricopeptide (TPR) repeat protein